MSLLQKVFRLDAVPDGPGQHLHSCPMPNCEHEFVIRRVEGTEDTRVMTVSYRISQTKEGPIRRVNKVKLPGSCWCGAPLPGRETLTFDSSTVSANLEMAEQVKEELEEQMALSEGGSE